MKIAVLLLAAGGSSRLGEPKQLLEIDGEPLVRRVARQLVALDAGPIGVVVGARTGDVVAALDRLPIHVISNAAWAHGLGTSVSAGATWAIEQRAVDPSIAAVLVALCDQPDVPVDHLRALLAASHADRTTIIATEYAGLAGVPAVFPRRLFSRLATLPEDAGAKSILNDPRENVLRIRCDAAAVDLDTREDVARWRAR